MSLAVILGDVSATSQEGRCSFRKATGIDWLGEVPAHWDLKRLKYTVSNIQSGVWGEEPVGEGSDIVCVRVADFDRIHNWVSPSKLTLRSVSERDQAGRLLCPDDLLIEKSGGGDLQPVGFVVRYTLDLTATCSNFVARLRVAGSCFPTYICYLHSVLYAARVNARCIKQNTGIQNLDMGAYFNVPVCVPPYNEQQAIARYLDRETSKGDALVAKKERLIALLQEKLAALISNAVTRGLDPNAPMRDSGIPWLGQVPAHWAIGPLGQHMPYISYGFTNPMPVAADGPYMLTANDINEGSICYETARRTTQEAFATLLTSKSRPLKGDILLTKDGSLGRVATFGEEAACINQSVAILRVNPHSMRVDFAYHLLVAYAYQERMIYDAGGTTIKHIYITRVRKMPVALPPLEEQTVIASYLDRETAKIDFLVAKVQEHIERLREYRTALISAAVTGKIDVRGEAG